jgi:mRNA interferase MazF
MISSNMTRAGHPSRVTVVVSTPEGQRTGLKLDSVILADNLQTVLDTEIDCVIGAWPDMALVDATLRHTLGL